MIEAVQSIAKRFSLQSAGSVLCALLLLSPLQPLDVLIHVPGSAPVQTPTPSEEDEVDPVSSTVLCTRNLLASAEHHRLQRRVPIVTTGHQSCDPRRAVHDNGRDRVADHFFRKGAGSFLRL